MPCLPVRYEQRSATVCDPGFTTGDMCAVISLVTMACMFVTTMSMAILFMLEGDLTLASMPALSSLIAALVLVRLLDHLEKMQRKANRPDSARELDH
ncbi:MAG: hypothetical protein EON60_05435 [Alphaproteobacteria bacterium]|nr:MAG: hypothetical protein EON60_05435 [Alphaproteobacteria bacterium]